MIGEAWAPLTALGWALAVWILLCAAAAAAALYAVTVTVWAIGRATVRAAKASCAWPSWRLAGFEVPEVDGEGRDAPAASQARTETRRPSWARTDKEAA